MSRLCRLGLHKWHTERTMRVCRRCGRREFWHETPTGGGYWAPDG